MRFLKYLTLILLCLNSIVFADSFDIDSSDVDMSHISKYNNQKNYGAVSPLQVGDNYIPGTRTNHIVIKFPTLADSMQNVGAANWDSAKLNLVVYSSTYLAPGTSDPDTLCITLHKLTTVWDEGEASPGEASGGVTWDSASATGTLGNAPNAPLDWTTDGGDYSGTVEDDTVYLVGGNVSQYDTISFLISSSTISDTLGEGLIVLEARVADGDDGDDAGSAAYLLFYSDDETNDARKPYLEVYYSAATDGFPKYRHSNSELGARHDNSNVGVRHSQ